MINKWDDYLSTFRSQLETFTSEIDHQQESITTKEYANSVFQTMKRVDELGFSLENENLFEHAVECYELSLAFMLQYQRLPYAEAANHHIAICYLTLTRIAIAADDIAAFFTFFKAYYEFSILAIHDQKDNRSPFNEVKYLHEQTHELVKKIPPHFKTPWNRFFELVVPKWDSLFEQDVITRVEYIEFMTSIVYIQIIFQFQFNLELLERHKQWIGELTQIIGRKAAIQKIYEQLDDLMYASFIPDSFQAFYRSLKNAFLGRNTISDQVVRVFISSTFSEFQMERDLIQTLVRPKLEQFCWETFGRELEIIDLRWGILIDEHLDQKESLYKVLSICEELIEQSKPYFILLAGNHLGTTIEPDIIHELFPNIQTDDPLSITQLEYLVRIYNQDHLDRILLLERTNEKLISPKQAQYLCQVKSQIKPENQFQLNDEMAQEAIASLIFEQVKAFLLSDLKPYHEQDELQWYMETYSQKMVGFETEVHLFQELFQRNDQRILIVQGSKGSGKTTFLSRMIQDSASIDHLFVFPYFPKQSKEVCQDLDWIQFMVESLQSMIPSLENQIEPPRDFFAYLHLLVSQVPASHRVLFVVDDFDMMIHTMEPFSWLKPNIFGSIQFLVSLSDTHLMSKLLVQGGVVIQLNNIESCFKDYVTHRFERANKKVDSDILHRLYIKLHTNNIPFHPLYISLLLDRLIYFRASDYQIIQDAMKPRTDGRQFTFHEAMTNHQRKVIHSFPNSTIEYVEGLIKEVCHENLGWGYVFALLAFSYVKGIEIREVNDLCEYANIPYSLHSFLELKNQFSHLFDFKQTSYIRLVNESLIQTIFETLPSTILKETALFLIRDVRTINEDFQRMISAYIYLKRFDFIAEIYHQASDFGKNQIVYFIMKLPFGFDAIERLIAMISLTEKSIRLIMYLLENPFHSFHEAIDRRITYLRQLKQRLIPYWNTIPLDPEMANFYYFVQRFILELSGDDIQDSEAIEWLQDLKMHLPHCELNSVFFMQYLKTLIPKFYSIRDGVNHIVDFLEVFNEILRQTTIEYQDTYIEYQMICHYLECFNADKTTDLLVNLASIYMQIYGGGNMATNYRHQIEILFFIATNYSELGYVKESIPFYLDLQALYNRDDFTLSYTTKDVQYRSTIANNLGNYYDGIANYIKLHNPDRFTHRDQQLNDVIELGTTMLQQAAYLSQITYNGSATKLRMINYHISNLNYATFLLKFTDNIDEGLHFMMIGNEMLIEAAASGNIAIERFLIGLLYTKIYLHYFNRSDYDCEDAFRRFVKNQGETHTDTANDWIDNNHIFQSAENQFIIMHIEKNEEYQRLEMQVQDYLSKF